MGYSQKGLIMNEILSRNLREQRNVTRLTQQQVANVLKIPRELVAMWENGSRNPSLLQLKDLALLYNVNVEDLNSEAKILASKNTDSVLLRGQIKNPEIELRIKNWLKFLDDLAELTECYQNAGKPPKGIDQGPNFTDKKSASKLANLVRNEYNLGMEPIANLFDFIDSRNILACKEDLGIWSNNDSDGISGVFYNHNKLGFCILINNQITIGRQIFTLAHEFAHALFHYNARAIISSNCDTNNPLESFADAFAANFLVPSKSLKNIITQKKWETELDAYKIIELAYIFKVSYAFMIYRLYNEGYIDQKAKDKFFTYKPLELASTLGIDSTIFEKQKNYNKLNCFPTTLLLIIKDLIENEILSLAQAADLLGASHDDIRTLCKNEHSNANSVNTNEINEYISLAR